MRHATTAALAALILIACNPDISGPDDLEYALAVVSGNGQTITAGIERTPEPVVGRLTATEDGGLAFTLGATPLHAQTQVGTGVPDALVCSAPVDPETGNRILESDPRALIPFVPCVETDSNGDATFFFEGARRAGLVRAEIRTQARDLPEVVAFVEMAVEAGPVDVNRFALCDLNVDGDSPLEVPPTMLEDAYGNRVPFALESQDTTIVRADSLTLTAVAPGEASLEVLRAGAVVARATAIVGADSSWIDLRGTGCGN